MEYMIARPVEPMALSPDTTGRASQPANQPASRPASMPGNPLEYQQNLQETNQACMNTKKPRKKLPASTVLSYWWSCGTTTNVDQTGLTCENQKPGHIHTAIFNDKQGGSTHDWANGYPRS